jgi:type I restriction enzyme M protein
MRHFATESGKSKRQFYTPAEVSRIIAKVVGAATGIVSRSGWTAPSPPGAVAVPN